MTVHRYLVFLLCMPFSLVGMTLQQRLWNDHIKEIAQQEIGYKGSQVCDIPDDSDDENESYNYCMMIKQHLGGASKKTKREEPEIKHKSEAPTEHDIFQESKDAVELSIHVNRKPLISQKAAFFKYFKLVTSRRAAVVLYDTNGIDRLSIEVPNAFDIELHDYYIQQITEKRIPIAKERSLGNFFIRYTRDGTIFEIDEHNIRSCEKRCSELCSWHEVSQLYYELKSVAYCSSYDVEIGKELLTELQIRYPFDLPLE